MLFVQSEETNAFQKHQPRSKNVFDICHYKGLKRYLMLIGVNPYAENNFRINMVYFTMVIVFYPMCNQCYISMCENDIDGMIEVIPHIFIGIISLIKFINIATNKKQFKELFDFVIQEWEMTNTELHVLDKITQQGSYFANLYRTSLTLFFLLFAFIPLIPPTLDIISPLNETRPRHQLISVNYGIIDNNDYFYVIYLHLTWSGGMAVLIIITVDSLYMVIIHHASGLFDMCGYQIEMASTNNNLRGKEIVTHNNTLAQYKQCVITHHKALKFFDTLQKCSQNLNLIQVGLNMVMISLTAVEIIMYMDRPEQLTRCILLLLGQQFHLLVISLNGQVLLNHALMLTDTVYSSDWYKIPVKFRRMIHMIQIRCNKPCILRAGGLYDMSVENFGTTVKASMSYFTMFLSLRE